MYLVRLDMIAMQKIPQSVVSSYELTTSRYAPNYMTLIVQEYSTLSILVIYNATSSENLTSLMDSSKHNLLLFQHNLGVGRERTHIGNLSQKMYKHYQICSKCKDHGVLAHLQCPFGLLR